MTNDTPNSNSGKVYRIPADFDPDVIVRSLPAVPRRRPLADRLVDWLAEHNTTLALWDSYEVYMRHGADRFPEDPEAAEAHARGKWRDFAEEVFRRSMVQSPDPDLTPCLYCGVDWVEVIHRLEYRLAAEVAEAWQAENEAKLQDATETVLVATVRHRLLNP